MNPDTRQRDPLRFVDVVQPLLEKVNVPGLVKALGANWDKADILHFLQCDNVDARKVAALALSFVGCRECLPAISEQLRDKDGMVNEMAEHAMWSIWFRASCATANHQLARGALALHRRDYDHAITHFDEAIEIDPNFAEAYNQRAILHYLKEEYEDSLLDCGETVKRMPNHFGAWAGMGHCHASLGHAEQAIDAYEKALKINPHLSCVRDAVGELETKRRH